MPSTDNVSAPIETIFARLAHHSKPGGLLAGLRWTDIPSVEVSGEKDLPDLRPAGAASADDYRAGSFAVPDLTVRLILATKIKDGFAASFHWAAKVQDALETSVLDQLSTHMNGQIVKPMRFVVESNSAVGQAFVTSITITLAPKPAQRGARIQTE